MATSKQISLSTGVSPSHAFKQLEGATLGGVEISVKMVITSLIRALPTPTYFTYSKTYLFQVLVQMSSVVGFGTMSWSWQTRSL